MRKLIFYLLSLTLINLTNPISVIAITCTPDVEISTNLGCIPIQPLEFTKWVLKYAILLGGGITFLLSVYGGVSIILASGNPEKINEAKQIITSAISGLLLILLSVFLLRFIGVDIFKIPGFKK